MATFKERCALTSRKCVSELGKIIPDLAEKLQFFWSHSSVFDLEEGPKNRNFKFQFKKIEFFNM